MKIAVIIVRILLGGVFVFFGSMGFLHAPAPSQLPPGPAGQFLTAMIQTHYTQAIAVVQVVGGLLVLAGFYVPLGLTLLGPVLVNILLYHLLMKQPGILPGLVTTLCWFFLFYRYRQNFAGLFAARA